MASNVVLHRGASEDQSLELMARAIDKVTTSSVLDCECRRIHSRTLAFFNARSEASRTSFGMAFVLLSAQRVSRMHAWQSKPSVVSGRCPEWASCTGSVECGLHGMVWVRFKRMSMLILQSALWTPSLTKSLLQRSTNPTSSSFEQLNRTGQQSSPCIGSKLLIIDRTSTFAIRPGDVVTRLIVQ